MDSKQNYAIVLNCFFQLFSLEVMAYFLFLLQVKSLQNWLQEHVFQFVLRVDLNRVMSQKDCFLAHFHRFQFCFEFENPATSRVNTAFKLLT